MNCRISSANPSISATGSVFRSAGLLILSKYVPISKAIPNEEKSPDHCNRKHGPMQENSRIPLAATCPRASSVLRASHTHRPYDVSRLRVLCSEEPARTSIRARPDYSNRKPQVSFVICSDSVRGYLRQFSGRSG